MGIVKFLFLPLMFLAANVLSSQSRDITLYQYGIDTITSLRSEMIDRMINPPDQTARQKEKFSNSSGVNKHKLPGTLRILSLNIQGNDQTVGIENTGTNAQKLDLGDNCRIYNPESILEQGIDTTIQAPYIIIKPNETAWISFSSKILFSGELSAPGSGSILNLDYNPGDYFYYTTRKISCFKFFHYLFNGYYLPSFIYGSYISSPDGDSVYPLKFGPSGELTADRIIDPLEYDQSYSNQVERARKDMRATFGTNAAYVSSNEFTLMTGNDGSNQDKLSRKIIRSDNYFSAVTHEALNIEYHFQNPLPLQGVAIYLAKYVFSGAEYLQDLLPKAMTLSLYDGNNQLVLKKDIDIHDPIIFISFEQKIISMKGILSFGTNSLQDTIRIHEIKWIKSISITP